MLTDLGEIIYRIGLRGDFTLCVRARSTVEALDRFARIHGGVSDYATWEKKFEIGSQYVTVTKISVKDEIAERTENSLFGDRDSVTTILMAELNLPERIIGFG